MRVEPPNPALTQAFSGHGGLQRPPGTSIAEDLDPALWGDVAGTNQWRNPHSQVVLGGPAVGEEPDEEKPASGGPLLSIPEVLFGRRVKPTALVTLALVAVLIGAAGGVVGWLGGRASNSLTDGSVTLAQTGSAIERAPGSISSVVSKVASAVVTLEVTTGGQGGVGSGVVISSDGYVLTNNHVISLAASNSGGTITAVFTDGTRVAATLVGRDPKTDLAVVKLKKTVANMTVIQLGKSADVKVGDPVIAIGSPLDLANTVTQGIVSAVHRPLTAAGENGDVNPVYDAIQTDAAINHGNSGGALLDATGALIGINSAISATSSDSGSIGLAFAIPIDQATQIAQALIRTGKVVHANAGLDTNSVAASSTSGAQVANVTSGGAGDKAGIKEGDVITKLNDRPIGSSADWQAALLDFQPGTTISVRISRPGVSLTVPVTLGSD
jgi:S1-C subfamily serine protease